jgi:hypothetical protein
MFDRIQDALDEARYTLSIKSRIEPSYPLPLPTTPVLEAYLNAKQSEDPTALSLEKMCSSPLGFYMVSQYCLKLQPKNSTYLLHN